MMSIGRDLVHVGQRFGKLPSELVEYWDDDPERYAFDKAMINEHADLIWPGVKKSATQDYRDWRKRMGPYMKG